MMLIVPGRVGTSSPELGVPTSFADISAFEIICETEETKAGYNPELSYGSHIFQDLVEAQILYMAVFPGEKTLSFRPDLLLQAENCVSGIPGGDSLREGRVDEGTRDDLRSQRSRCGRRSSPVTRLPFRS